MKTESQWKIFLSGLAGAVLCTMLYYGMVMAPRTVFANTLLEKCLESLDVRQPGISAQFFAPQAAGGSVTGVWACERGAKNYRKSGVWHF